MSSSVRILPHYIYDDYLQWEGRWELIDGIPYAMNPLPVPKHQSVGVNLLTEFRLTLKNCNNNCKVYPPIDYKVKDDTILQPDMLVICGDIHKKFLDFLPSLVAEILSPSTALKDRHTKFEIYQLQGIPYFLIINCDAEFAEIYQLQNGRYELADSGREASFTFQFGDCSVPIRFAEIWE